MARNTSVTLGQYYDDYIANLISEGRFQTVSEALRAALRLHEKEDREYEAKLKALRKMIEEGENSPVVENFDPEEFIQEMKRKYG